MTEALAAEAAALWGGQVVRLLANRENAVFEIRLPGGRAALRLHRQGYQARAAIEAELWFCAALAGAGIAVPAALPSGDGSFLRALANGRLASVIAWAPGQALGAGGQRSAMASADFVACYHRLGQLLAGFHAAADRLTLPEGFSRPCWDVAGLVGEAPRWGRFWDHPSATTKQKATLLRARALLQELLADHARSGDFGLIHADVFRENILVGPQGMTLIDFDDSGWGFRGYDLGTAMVQNFDAPDRVAIEAALVAGYGEIRPISAGIVRLFTLARACASVGWTMPRLQPSDPVCASHIARAITCARRLGI